MRPWVSLLRVSPLFARIGVRVECGCGSVRGDRVMVQRDPVDRYRMRLRCVEHAPNDPGRAA
ncbi:MAG: hypothetical protein ACREH4_01360 [Vitreimonas sp.]